MRVGQSVWHSARISENNATIDTYDKPKEIKTRFNYFTVMPANSRGYAEVMKYGEDVNDTWTAIANANVFGGKINIGDLFWLDGEKPQREIEEQYGNGSSATAVVKNVSYVNLTVSITLTRYKSRITK